MGVMDRLIALLAALVGLIALGGALLVHNSATATMQQQATEIAGLKAALNGALSAAPVEKAAVPSPAAPASTGPDTDSKTVEIIAALEGRGAALEQTTRTQATDLAAARAALDARADIVPSARATDVAVAEPPAQPVSSGQPAAYSADGPSSDCIPLGTRFMSQSGDSFPICKTSVVVSVSAVSDGSAVVEGAGVVAAGGFANLPAQGCTIMVFTADAAGFAEMRVSCT
jgi:hypothetical protein